MLWLLNNKKGLLKFIIGVIIGILCVIPLLYLSSTLMSIFFSNQQEVLQAKGTLDEIQGNIDALTIGESISTPLLIYSPAGWWLLGFDKESATSVGLFGKEVKPSKECEKKNLPVHMQKFSRLHAKIRVSGNGQAISD